MGLDSEKIVKYTELNSGDGRRRLTLTAGPVLDRMERLNR